MPSVTARNLPDKVHRAIRVRVARRGRSILAEMRDSLGSAVKRQGRVMLGSLLAAIGREVKLTDEAFADMGSVRDRAQARAASLD